MLRLYNTLTRKVEEFSPLHPSAVTYYSCGPTVYDYAHIGHARTFIFADVLQRALQMNDYKVKRVMNITDVGHLTSDSDTGEDKMEKGAAREKKTVWEVAEHYTKDFMQMLTVLKIEKPEIICKATDHIPEMIELITVLEKKGFTYTIEDGVYFDTRKDPSYGKLTGQTFSQLQKTLKAGARVEIVSGKRNPTDFALWKFTQAGVKRQMEWDSPWGKGFPGWHIECSAMSMKYLGETLDIHTGGVDHIPVHHTNEIAQSEAASGKLFVKYWLHAQHLLVDGEKMSKSLGNFYRISDIEKKGYHPLALRYLFLTASYRAQMNFTWESLTAAQNAYGNLVKQIQFLLPFSQVEGNETAVRKSRYSAEFVEAISDDLNTARGLAILWELLGDGTVKSEVKYSILLRFDAVLGLGLAAITNEVPEDVQDLVKKRNELRSQKKFAEADSAKKRIEEKGFDIQDTAGGTIVVPNKLR